MYTETGQVKSAVRILDFFETFARSQIPLTISELARAMTIPVSSCFEITRSLERRGYLYSLGRPSAFYPNRRLHSVATRITDKDPIGAVVQPILSEMCAKVGEAIMLGALADTDTVIQSYEAPANPLRYHVEVGDRRPILGTSMGKSLMHRLPEKELTALFDRLALKPAARKALQRTLVEEGKRGYFSNDGQTVKGVFTIGAPLDIQGGSFALCIAGPADRMKSNLESHVRILLETIGQFGNLGGRPAK